MALTLAACSTQKPAKNQPPPGPRTATFEITSGVRVLATIALPPGFTPIAGRPPLWLQNGAELGVVGTLDGHTIVLGYGEQQWQTGRVLASETGEGAAEPGTILDIAPSPDGLTLASAVAVHGQKRVDIILRDLIATGPGNSIASFDGKYDSVSMAWLNNSTVAIALRAHPQPEQPAAESDKDGDSYTPPPAPADGLQILVVTGASSVAPLKLSCRMSPLSWSARGIYAVGQGDPGIPAIAIDRRTPICSKIPAPGPLNVLSWNRNRESMFLYTHPVPSANSVGVFRYDLVSGDDKLVAVSSSAASFTAGDSIIALGSQKLSWAVLQQNPNIPVTAEIAISDSQQSNIAIKSLGFQTLPAMLAQSTMAYSKDSDSAAIETFAPAGSGTTRKIIIYSVTSDSAFVVAQGPARGATLMSWSVHGRWLAILDGDATRSSLTVIAPPR